MVFGRSGIGSKALLSCFVLLKTYTIRCEQDKLDHQTETINFFFGAYTPRTCRIHKYAHRDKTATRECLLDPSLSAASNYDCVRVGRWSRCDDKSGLMP